MSRKIANEELLNVKEVLLLAGRVFGAALLGLLAVSAAYELVLRPRHAFHAQYWHFMQDEVRPSIIFLADSRGVYALRHGSMDRGFYNYAHFGEYPFGQILRARHAIRDKSAIRTVVFQLDLYVVQRDRAFRPLLESRGFYEPLLFSSRRDIEDIIHPDSNEFWRNAGYFVFPLAAWWERADFWGAVRQTLTAVGLDNAPPPGRFLNECGELINTGPSLDKLEPAERKRLAVEDANVRYKNNAFDPEIGKLYTDFVAFLSARGITAVGIQLPESGDYRAASRGLIDPAAERFIASLAIPKLDYRDIFVDRPDFFTDADHLSDEGARQLSAKVADDLRRLVAASPQAQWNCRSVSPLRARIWPYQMVIARALGLSTR